MKLIKPVLYSFLFLFGVIYQNLTAQQNFTISKLNFTFTIGYTFPGIEGSHFTSQGVGASGTMMNPIYLEAGYNYSNNGLVSIYFSDASVNTGNFKWYDSLGATHTYSYAVSIVTIGLSGRYYLGNGDHLRPYVGAMLGYTFINLTSGDQFPPAGSVTIADSQGTFAYQVYGGLAYYFNRWLGLDAHAGYGNNYYAAAGLSFKFQVKQKIYTR
jgi:hypothetical protein